ncbi:MAG: flotillin-like protein FloA [Candidatus Brocadiia bacterium]
MELTTIGIGIGLLVLIVVGIIVSKFFFLWLQALLSGAPVKLLDLVGMWFRKVDSYTIVVNRINAVKAGLNIPTDKLEAHYLAGGNVTNVVRALIAANKAGIPLITERAMAIDLAGRDVLGAVHTSVLPKVIDCPKQSEGTRATIDAVAKDGIQLRARARVTVRTNLDRLVGGATEETIIARVGEGIVTTIGSADTYKMVLASPDSISKKVLEKGLDAGSAFEILSIDIADVDVGDNIGAKLQTDQAAADLKIAQAKAETRRAMAVASEQEMKAKTQEMRAKVVEAESEVPKALAYAFREGKLGVMDYYNIKNIQADTEMRHSIAEPKQPEKGNPEKHNH